MHLYQYPECTLLSLWDNKQDSRRHGFPMRPTSIEVCRFSIKYFFWASILFVHSRPIGSHWITLARLSKFTAWTEGSGCRQGHMMKLPRALWGGTSGMPRPDSWATLCRSWGRERLTSGARVHSTRHCWPRTASSPSNLWSWHTLIGCRRAGVTTIWKATFLFGEAVVSCYSV